MKSQESNSQSLHKISIFTGLFSASMMSGLVVTIIDFAILLSAAIPLIRANILQNNDINFSQFVPSSLAGGLSAQAAQVGQSQAAAVLTTFLFWGIIGVVAYIAVAGVSNFINGLAEFHDDLQNVHAKPQSIWSETFNRIIIRIIVLVLWLLYAWVFAHLLLPYVIAAASAAAADPFSLSGLAYILLAFVVCWLSLHMHVVFLRLMFLRERVFSRSA